MAGRTLSKKNETTLRTAHEAIGTVLATLDEGDKEESKEGARPAAGAELEEAASLGNALEADLHTGLVARVNGMFADGRLNRPERDVLLAAAATALDSFHAAVESDAPAVYSRKPWEDAPDPDAPAMQESALAGDYVPLAEAAIRGDGTALLKIIAPGWGSSGYYPKEVLKRDGPQVFTAGTKGYWDHATPTEEAERPEGSLSKLASELVSDAQWLDTGPAGPGLYAHSKVFTPYQEAVNELAPHIGVSIRATGRTAQGEAEGRKGPIVQQIVAARSVDWVTQPGAGGQVVEMFEAARDGARARVPAPDTDNEEEHVDNKEFELKLDEAQKQIDALQAALTLREARDVVRDALGTAQVPAVTRARLLEQLAANPPLQEGALDVPALIARVGEAVKAEIAYLAEAAPAATGSGRIVGMGAGSPAQPGAAEDVSDKMKEAFGLLGLSESEAKIAGAGRVSWSR